MPDGSGGTGRGLTLTHRVVELEHLQQEAGDDARDADEQVRHDHGDVRGRRLVEQERRRVHHRRDRPTARGRKTCDVIATMYE